MSPRNDPGPGFIRQPMVILINTLVAILISSFITASACAENPLIRFYQEQISPVDGSRCPMHPTCSEYARKAIKIHGPILGWIMACDRLVRCGRDEVRLSFHVMVHGHEKVLDRVSDNDFWWFDKQESKEQSRK